MKLTISLPPIQEIGTPLPLQSPPLSRRQLLHTGWTDLVERFDLHFPLEWFGHLTFADAVHPEQANRRFNRWWREVNIAIFGKRYRERGEGAYCFRASEYQTRGVLHYHILAGGGVRALRRLSFMDLWASENGFARIYPFDRKQGAIRYTTKYAVKGGEIDIIASPDVLGQVRGRLVQIPFSLN
jgi:hypothetical protein